MRGYIGMWELHTGRLPMENFFFVNTIAMPLGTFLMRKCPVFSLWIKNYTNLQVHCYKITHTQQRRAILVLQKRANIQTCLFWATHHAGVEVMMSGAYEMACWPSILIEKKCFKRLEPLLKLQGKVDGNVSYSAYLTWKQESSPPTTSLIGRDWQLPPISPLISD